MTRDEAEIYSRPGHLIRRLQQIAVAIFLEETAQFDITPVQYSALLAVRNHNGLDQTTLMTMSLFEYMIANTDVSIYKLHNVKLLVTESHTEYPVPYDFDYSGLVDTPYAMPDPRLGISTVRDRVYRGPCVSETDFDGVLEKFRAKKADVMALYDAVPDLNPAYRRQARSYIESFYAETERTRLKRTLVDRCAHAPSM